MTDPATLDTLRLFCLRCHTWSSVKGTAVQGCTYNRQDILKTWEDEIFNFVTFPCTKCGIGYRTCSKRQMLKMIAAGAEIMHHDPTIRTPLEVVKQYERLVTLPYHPISFEGLELLHQFRTQLRDHEDLIFANDPLEE